MANMRDGVGQSNKKSVFHCLLILSLVFSLVLLAGLTAGQEWVHADTATDRLAVRVGYTGMELSEYVYAGREGGYSWVELSQDLPIQELAYSYFQSSDAHYREYTAIVDSARGFYVTDLLDYVHVNFGDVQSLKFYVEDHKGIQAAFDRDALFGTRYYYDDLSGHRRAIYDEVDDTKLVGFDFSEARNYAYQVDPMLALEDNWAQFNEEIGHIGPDFAALSTGTRFRLLFGQQDPLETLTSASAKYVSCVYVTLRGKPEVGEIPDMDEKIGSHTVDVTVKSDDPSVRDQLERLMNIGSSNEDVLRITGYEVTPDTAYSDLATVRIHYDIVGEGDASLSIGVGHGEDAGSGARSKSITGTTAESGEDPSGQQTSGQENSPENVKEKETEKDPKPAAGNSASDHGASSAGGTDRRSDQSSSDVKTSGAGSQAQTVKERAQTQKQDAASGVVAYELSEDAVAKFMAAAQTDPVIQTEEVTQLKVEDRSEDKRRQQRSVLILTGLACLGIGLGGGAVEEISFRRRLRKRL